MKMFEPVLALVSDEHGTCTLVSATPTPNTCYSAGPVQFGAPAGYAVSGTTLAVQLEIVDAGRPLCLPVITPVQHRLEQMRIDASIRTIQVFIVVAGKVAGHDALPVPVPPQCSQSPLLRDNSLAPA